MELFSIRIQRTFQLVSTSILSFFSLRIPFAAKKYIICYPAMDFPEVEACGTGW